MQTVVAVAAALLAWRRFDLSDLALTVGTAYMALQSRRFAPLFVFVATLFLARNLAALASRMADARPSLARAAPHLALATAAVATLATAAGTARHLRVLSAPGLFAGMTHLGSFSVEAVGFLRANPLPGARMYDFYAWGGFLLWALPGVPIYVDGRAAVAYPPEIATEYRSIERGDARALATLDRYGANVVLHHVGHDLPLKLRRQQDWVRVYHDGRAVLFVRRTPDTAAWLERFERGEIEYPDTPGVQLFLAEIAAQGGATPPCAASGTWSAASRTAWMS
ncbi:MAG: hypothetical protein FJ148_24235 [Deltaproteobacteria bacterium]|nr:hypothetical protein [Deltaproteobacteria bacterium]